MGINLITFLEGTTLRPFEDTPRRYQHFFNEFDDINRAREALKQKFPWGTSFEGGFCDNWPCGYVTIEELLKFDYGSTAEIDGTDLISWAAILSSVDDSFFTTLNELKNSPPQTRLFYGFS